MKLELALRDVINLNDGLTSLKDRKPSIAMSYKIAKNLYYVTEALNIYKTVEQDIIAEHIDEEATNKLSSKEREEGRIIIKDSRGYNSKMRELNSANHDIEIDFLTLEELEENFGDLTPDTLFKLMPIIKN